MNKLKSIFAKGLSGSLIASALLSIFNVESRAIYTIEIPTKNFKVRQEDGSLREFSKEHVQYTGWSGLSQASDGIIILSDIVEKRGTWITYMGIMRKQGDALLPVKIVNNSDMEVKTLGTILKFSAENKKLKKVTTKKAISKHQVLEKQSDSQLAGINIWKGTTDDIELSLPVGGNEALLQYIEYPYDDTKAIHYGACSVGQMDAALSSVLSNLSSVGVTNTSQDLLKTALVNARRAAAGKPSASNVLNAFELALSNLQKALV